MSVAPIPPEYGTLTCYLVVADCGRAIEFYKSAFGAEERFRLAMPDGTIGHAELQFGDRRLMLAEASTSHPATSSLLSLYVKDCDATFADAVAAGAIVVDPPADKFYGDRAGTVSDPFGQRWTIMTHTEDVTPEEMEARMMAMMGG